MAGRTCNREVRFVRAQVRELRPLSGASLRVGRGRNRALRPHLRLTAEGVVRYHLPSMAARQSESSVKVQVRRKVAGRELKVSDSAIRPLQQARLNMSVVDLNIGHRPPAGLRVKQQAREKEGRALTVNPAGRRRQGAECPLPAGQPEAEHPHRERSAAKSNHNTERNNPRKERRGPGRNNSSVIL